MPPNTRSSYGPQKRRLNPRVIIVVVFVVVVVLALVIRGHSSPPTTSVPSSLPATTSTTSPNTTSSTTTLPAKPTLTLPSQDKFPAYQHMPYVAGGIVITVTGTTANGRFEIEVFSETLTLAQEHTIWNNFLSRYHDPGTKYLVAFAPAPPAG